MQVAGSQALKHDEAVDLFDLRRPVLAALCCLRFHGLIFSLYHLPGAPIHKSVNKCRCGFSKFRAVLKAIVAKVRRAPAIRRKLVPVWLAFRNDMDHNLSIESAPAAARAPVAVALLLTAAVDA